MDIPKNNFDWAETKNYVDSLASNNLKISYLLEQIRSFKNRDKRGELGDPYYETIPREVRFNWRVLNYADRCEAELEHITLEQYYLPDKCLTKTK